MLSQFQLIHKKSVAVIFCLLFIGLVESFGQEFSANTLSASVGLGVSNNSRADGFGINWGMGYQRYIWNNRLRLVPSFTFGKYTSDGIEDVPDAYFNSMNLKLNLNLDVFKIKSFSVFVGTGLVLNNSSGLVGTGGYPGSYSSDYFNEVNFTYNGQLGLRFAPESNGFGYELLLLDGSFESKNYFSELSVLRVKVFLKLK